MNKPDYRGRHLRRPAAIFALVCVVALPCALVVIMWHHRSSLVLGLLGLAIAAIGGWLVVAYHMPRRGFGAIAAAVGLGLIAFGLIDALVDAEAVLTRITIIATVWVLALLAARFAVDQRPVATPASERRVPTHPVLICNPWSGGGKVDKFDLVELAGSMGVEVVMLEHGLDVEQLARDAVSRGADCLGMAGGDGSQALVASIAVEHDLPFVCVTAGTRNHFALDLGLDREDPRASMAAFEDAVERHVDYATVNGRLFVNNVSLGVYATVVQQDEYRDAKAATFSSLLPHMLGPDTEPFDLQFTDARGVDIDGAFLILVSNNPYVIGASVDNFQRRRLDSGRLGVVAVNSPGATEAAALITASATGLRHHSKYWHEFTCDTFEIRSRSGTAYVGVDGEALDMETPLRFEIHPRSLRLLVPEGNREASNRRAAREVHVTDLVRVALARPQKGPDQ